MGRTDSTHLVGRLHRLYTRALDVSLNSIETYIYIYIYPTHTVSQNPIPCVYM